jgi:transposase
MYYKSLLETLKDEGDNIIRVEDEFSSNDEYRVEITLIPKDINICPSCNSTNVIKFGRKDRTIKDDFISNRPTLITLFYNRLKCNNCYKMSNDTLN